MDGFGAMRGPWPDDRWKRSWGEEPPYHTAAQARRSVTMFRRAFAIVVLCVLAAHAANAARWEINGAATEVALDTTTLGPSPQFPGMTGIWVVYSPSLSVDCSPPRGCYAKTQRIYYTFNCSPRYAVPTERISIDLNGSVINRELRETADPYSPAYDVGAAQILDTYCPVREKERRR